MKPYVIHIDQAVLDDLNVRLAHTRFPDQLNSAEWDYGTELDYLQALCTYWRDKYDWRKHEAKLNAFDHFKTEIEGRALHFIHQRSEEENALPLIVTHGWPGSIVEFMKIIGPLTDPASHGGNAEDAFHVVCPSIPGYGFSEAPREPGFDIARVAEVNAALMAELGYDRYGAQGGDWGSVATAWLGLKDPDHVCGLHLNMVLGKAPDRKNKVAGLSDEELSRLEAARKFNREETGYSRIQGTKPQTLGYGLNDSPAGLAAWIVEKFRTWSDCGGDIESRFTKDELLTNIMLYWANANIASSVRLYYETAKAGRSGPPDSYVDTPTGCAIFPHELTRLPRSWAENSFNVTRWTEMPRGGHFAAMEEPELLVEDIRVFFRDLRG